eukprot:1023143_1
MSRVVSVFMLLAFVLSISSVDSSTNSHSDSNGDGNSDSSDEPYGSSHTCEVGYSLTRDGKIKCDSSFACDGCDPITCNSCNVLNCGGKDSCTGAKAKAYVGSSAFRVECNGERSCEEAVIKIFNDDAYDFKGVKCNALNACYDADITINIAMVVRLRKLFVMERMHVMVQILPLRIAFWGILCAMGYMHVMVLPFLVAERPQMHCVINM